MKLRFFLTFTMFMLLAVLIVRCGYDDEPAPAGTSVAGQAAGRSGVCAQIEATRSSLADIRNNFVPYDEAAIQQATARARANIDSLATTAQRSGGAGSEEVETLVSQLQEMQRILAQPDLAVVVPQARAQADAISATLDAMEIDAGCPD